MEFQNGYSLDGYPNLSNALVKFTTNNQSITFGGTARLVLNNAEIVNIILTISGNHVSSGLTINGTIAGAGTAIVKTINTCGSYLNSITPFLSIIHDSTSSTATTYYQRNGNQNVIGGIYGSLNLSGSATPNNKTLQGNVSVLNTYAVSGNAVKIDNAFTFGNP